MTQTNGFGIVMLLVAVGLLVTGLISGRMPGTVGSAEPSRAENPWGFWLLGCAYGAVALIGIYLSVKGE